MGARKTAIFAVIPDNDSSFNFIVGMLYTQLFQQLYYSADYVHGGRLPVHVHFVMDEFANVTMPEVLEAAHIKPFKYKGEDTVANGFAMRNDIHILFDTGHLRISDQGDVKLSSRARMDYGALIPPRIVIPDFTNKAFLKWRWENYNGL